MRVKIKYEKLYRYIEDVGDMKLVRCHRKGLFLKN